MEAAGPHAVIVERATTLLAQMLIPPIVLTSVTQSILPYGFWFKGGSKILTIF